MNIAQSHVKQVSLHIIQKLNKMFHKCDHCDYESNRMHNIRRHVKNKHESHHPNNENKVDNDVSPERLPSSPTKINHGLN